MTDKFVPGWLKESAIRKLHFLMNSYMHRKDLFPYSTYLDSNEDKSCRGMSLIALAAFQN